jgi:predicted ArsR family transcriptional regulator
VPDALSKELLAFLGEHIDSVYQLELLLFVRARSAPVSAAAIVRQLYLPPETVDGALRDLVDRGLVVASRHGAEAHYACAPASELAALIDELADAYADYRVRIIAQIYSRGGSRKG